MAFNNHIGIYATMEEFDNALMQQALKTPWVAYIGTPGTPEYKVIYPDDLVAKNDEGVNIAGEILKLKPVICKEGEYDILITEGQGWVTDINATEPVWVSYDPEVYYYTYDASELES